MGGAIGGCVGGDNVPPLLGPAGYRGYGGGPMKMIFASTADSLYSMLYKWLNFNSLDSSSRHLPSYWYPKDVLGRVSTVHPTGLLHLSNLHANMLTHIAAKIHETNLAITKLSLSLIHNTIRLGLPMFINATTRQQISIYSVGPYWYLLDCIPRHLEKWGTKVFFRSLRSRILFYTPTLKSAAPPYSDNALL